MIEIIGEPRDATEEEIRNYEQKCQELNQQTEEQKQAYYRNNPDLFTRYWGDSFPYEDVEQIIEKRLREEAYDALVQDLLRQR